jgi:pyrimidine nucleoside transport protein
MTLNNGTIKYLHKGGDAEAGAEMVQAENSIGNYLVQFRSTLEGIGVRHKRKVKLLLTFATVIYNVYLILSINYTVSNDIPIGWCDGLGFLLLLTAIFYWSLFYYCVIKRHFGKRIKMDVIGPLVTSFRRTTRNR